MALEEAADQQETAWLEESPQADAEVQTVALQQPFATLLREVVETALLTLLIFWVVHTMTGRFRIEGQSMEPTLHEPEYVLINKLSYLFEEPVRGDIIVLRFPGDPERRRDFIKRIIGLPGDHVVVANGTVTVNGVPLSEPYINAPPSYTDDVTVPADSFYVLGDNRNNSHDSHSWNVAETGAFLPRDDIIGKAWLIYWGPDDWGLIPHVTHGDVPAAGS